MQEKCSRTDLRTKRDSIICRKDKTSSRRTDDVEALSERLGSLQINEEASSSEYEQTDTEMSIAQQATAAAAVSKNVQTGLPKNIVPDPG